MASKTIREIIEGLEAMADDIDDFIKHLREGDDVAAAQNQKELIDDAIEELARLEGLEK